MSDTTDTTDTTENVTPIKADRLLPWQLACRTLEHLYRGRTVINSDPALVMADMSAGRVDYGDALNTAYQDLISHVIFLAQELDQRGVDLSRSDRTSVDCTPMLGMTNDTMEIYEMMRTAIIRLVGLRGILRRRAEKAAP